MTRNWLMLWRADQLDSALTAGKLSYAASEQFSRISVGDRVWIVGTRKNSVREHRLVTIGYVDVARLVGLVEARKLLRSDPWNSKFHAFADAGSMVAAREVRLDDIVAELRFASPANRLDVNNGAINPQQLQSMRELTTDSASLLQHSWDSGITRKKSAARGATRLPAEIQRKVRADDLWQVRQELSESGDYAPFEDSDGYDVLLEDGRRLPPKALFGKALSRSLHSEVVPDNFTGGEKSVCHAVLSEHGYHIVKKEQEDSEPVGAAIDPEWREGNKKLRIHLQSERKSGLAAAKRANFIEKHGKLHCEECGLVPSKAYTTKYADACIEVHHARVAVADMSADHISKLSDLKCLCANCHRIEHKRLRFESAL